MHRLAHATLKPVVFVLGLLPLAWLIHAIVSDALGANPAEALIRSLGDWALRFLVIVLAVTPARVVLGWPWLARLRRMLGLYVFFYSTLHWLAYAWFDMGLDPTIAPGVGTPVRGGPTYRETQLCMEMLADCGALGSADLVELNPALDVRNQTAELAVDLLESLFGKSTLMRA